MRNPFAFRTTIMGNSLRKAGCMKSVFDSSVSALIQERLVDPFLSFRGTSHLGLLLSGKAGSEILSS